MRDCWIFDMDGTLCNSDHRQHHLQGGKKDWAGWFADMDKDPVHSDIAMFFDVAVKTGITVFVCTGREEQYREVSEKWLSAHWLEPTALLMRKTGDRRDDSVVKKEMLDALRIAKFNPVMVFEDRDRVVKMWRENGIRCLQVAPGDF